MIFVVTEVSIFDNYHIFNDRECQWIFPECFMVGACKFVVCGKNFDRAMCAYIYMEYNVAVAIPVLVLFYEGREQ